MIISILIILGLCIGSFINALVWRIYKQSKLSGYKSRKKFSILNGRSMCVHCKHELSWLDLIPVLSWTVLKGKCRYCNKSISIQYPLIEAITSFLFVFSYYVWPYRLVNFLDIFYFCFWLMLLTGLISLAVYDFKWKILPDRLVFPLIAVASLFTIIGFTINSVDSAVTIIFKLIFSLLISSGIFYFIYQISNGKWIGGGDIKLGLVLGLILSDPFKAFLMLFGSSILGIIFIVPAYLLGKVNKSSKIPFGPFLILSTFIVFLFGQIIIDWYLNKVLLLG